MKSKKDFFETTGVLKTPDLLLLEKELLDAEGPQVGFKYLALGRSMIKDNNTDGLNLVLFLLKNVKRAAGRAPISCGD